MAPEKSEMDSKQMGDKYDDMAEEILRVKSYAGTDEAVRELAAALRQARAEAIEECRRVVATKKPQNERSDWTQFAEIRNDLCENIDRDLDALAHPHKEG